MGRQRRAGKKNKIITLATERCEKIKNLYINKNKIKQTKYLPEPGLEPRSPTL